MSGKPGQAHGDFAIDTARSSSINQAYLLLSEYASGYDVSFAVRVLNATDFALRNPDLADASASLELQSEDEVKQFRYLCDANKLSRLFGTAESESAWSVVSGAKGQQHYPVLLQNYFELVGERGTPSQRSWALKQLQKPGKLGLTPMHRNAMVSGAAHTADFDFIEKISAVTNRRTDEVLSIPITNGLLMRYQSLTHQIGVQISLAEQGGAAVGDEDQ